MTTQNLLIVLAATVVSFGLWTALCIGYGMFLARLNADRDAKADAEPATAGGLPSFDASEVYRLLTGKDPGMAPAAPDSGATIPDEEMPVSEQPPVFGGWALGRMPPQSSKPTGGQASSPKPQVMDVDA